MLLNNVVSKLNFIINEIFYKQVSNLTIYYNVPGFECNITILIDFVLHKILEVHCEKFVESA